MNLMQARELGNLLRGRRLELGLSTHQLGAQVGVRQSTIVRIEKGRFASPRPDKLARIAKALGITSTDIYAQAGYLVRDELPSLGPYLSAKYPNMPEEAVAQVLQLFQELAARHGGGPNERSATSWRRP